jgi:hypothetical protein
MDRVRKQSFALHPDRVNVCPVQRCKATRVRAFVKLPGIRDTVRHADRLRTGLRPRPNPNAQHDVLTTAGCEQIFIDKASGKLARRPELDKALLVARRRGDQFVITKLDRLGRSLEHLIELSDGRRVHTVAQIAAEFGVTRPTIYQHLASLPAETPTATPPTG